MAAVMVLRFGVNFLLLMAVGRIRGWEIGTLETVTAALVGAAYAGACLHPDLTLIQSRLWRGLSMAAMALIAYGTDWRTGCLFGLLDLAVSGLILHRNTELLVAAAVCALCWLGGRRRILPVQIYGKGKTLQLNALVDTGNELRDPVTGERVLVTGSAAAQELLELCTAELENPIDTMARNGIPGMRLIPYRGVGVDGMLLGMRFARVRIGGRETPGVVAFAPGEIGNGEYQAIIGGV